MNKFGIERMNKRKKNGNREQTTAHDWDEIKGIDEVKFKITTDFNPNRRRRRKSMLCLKLWRSPHFVYVWKLNLPLFGRWTGLRRYWFLRFSEWHCEKFTMSGELHGFHSSYGSSSLDFIIQIHLQKKRKVQIVTISMNIFFPKQQTARASKLTAHTKIPPIKRQNKNVFSNSLLCMLFLSLANRKKKTTNPRNSNYWYWICFVKFLKFIKHSV